MVCPHCGSVSPGVGGRCGSCGRPAGGNSVAAATATPLPTGATSLAGPAVTGPLAVGEMFGDRYRILKTLGAGGMGVVYQAWDQTLEVAVALKVIRPDAVTDPEAARDLERRFKRELLLARQVTHRNVVRIHDFGEIGGIKYISMPFIEGRDLATVLAEAGRLPLRQAIDVIRQVGSGLAVAHEAGVVHRDLKPENIMVDAEGRALIMDFGISRTVSTGGTTIGLTVAGAIVGTLEYMAPEQARGEAADQRADVYALGLIFYDMLVGRRRLERSTSPMVEMMGRLEEPPPRLRTMAPDLPEQLEAIVSRALDPDSAKRYQSVADLIADLDTFEKGPTPALARRLHVSIWAVAALTAFLIAVIGATAWWILGSRHATTAAAQDPISVLIADFANRTGDPLFTASLEQALAIGLEGAPFISSYRRDIAQRLAEQIRPGSQLDESTARLVAVREGVKVAITGSVSQAGSGYTLTVKAVDPAQGTPLFEASADARSKADVLTAVATLTSRVRDALGDTTPESARRAAAETFTTGSLEALHEYSLAQALSRGRDAEAIEHYRAAVRHDPKFGRAYSGWAISASRLGRRDEAAEQWKGALGLLDRMTDREKYRTLGGYYLDFAHDYQQAIENYRTLVSLYPADEAGQSNLALAYFYTLNFPKALEHGRRAVDIYPSDARFRNNVALYAMYAGDFKTAAEEASRVSEQDGRFHKAFLPIAMAALSVGDAQGAATAYDGMAATGAAGASLASIGRGDAAMYHGRFSEAVKILTEGAAVDERAANRSALARKQIALAEASAALGQRGAALAALDAALRLSDLESVLVPAAMLHIDLERRDRASQTADVLAQRLAPQSRAYAKLIQARLALAADRPVQAIDALREGLRSSDLWLLRFYLGIAYVAAGQVHAAAALSELESCLKRLGEATAVFLDDVPTLRYTAPVHYWLARARHDLGLLGPARESYTAYAALRPEPARDPLAADARARLDQLR
jgi:eukaryotic-like serine/threonine-protein kinase